MSARLEKSALRAAVLPRTPGAAPVSIVCGLFVLLVYIHFLAPDIVGGDSADLVGQAYRVGVCHATGYPLTVMAGKLFTWIPVGGIPYRVNLLSAVSAAAAVTLTVALVNLLIGDQVLAGLSGVVLGLSPIFWSQAEFAEVYAFGALFTAGSFLLFLLFLLRDKRAYFLLGMFVFGLSWTAHMNNSLHLPAVLCLVYAKRKDLSPADLCAGLLLFVLGLMPYVWMMHRAAVVPPFSEFNPPSTPERLLPYALGIAHNPVGPRSVEFLLGKTAWVFKIYLLSFLGVGVVPAMYGLIRLWRENRTWSIFTILVAVFNMGFVIEYHFYLDVYAFLIPSLIVTAMWIGAGLKSLRDRVSERLGGGGIIHALTAAWIVSALLLFPSPGFLSAVRQWAHPFPAVDMRGFRAPREFVTYAMENLERDALVFAPWYQFTLLKYAQTVEGARPDLIVLLHKHTRPEDLLSVESDPEILKRLTTPERVYFIDARGISPFPKALLDKSADYR